jgi:hypothetical protein
MADLRKKLIKRIAILGVEDRPLPGRLTHPLDSVVHPNRTRTSHWIELRFTTSAELERVIKLVQIAIRNM